MRLFISSLLIICLLSACGHKGPLYLPNEDDKNRISTQKTEEK